MYHKLFLFLITCFISTNLLSQSEISDALIMNEATLRAATFLNLIPEGREADYGFNSRSDFSRIKIEKPYKTYYISADDNQLTFALSDWRVPISVDGDYKTLLTVQNINGKAEVVDLGGNKLAQKIQEFEKLYTTGDNLRLMIRNTYLNQDYITVNFSLSSTKVDANNLDEINKNSLQSLYQLSSDQPTKISIYQIYYNTMGSIINKQQEDK